jgi:hypothetical protein
LLIDCSSIVYRLLIDCVSIAYLLQIDCAVMKIGCLSIVSIAERDAVCFL